MPTPLTRGPCPDRFIDDVGVAFVVGAFGGAAYQFPKGFHRYHRGERSRGGFEAIRMSVPRTAGSFAAWGGLFSSFDCTISYLCQIEDSWNPIIASAATGFTLQVRQSLGAASRSAVFGGVLFALIEGVGLSLERLRGAPWGVPPVDEPPRSMDSTTSMPLSNFSS